MHIRHRMTAMRRTTRNPTHDRSRRHLRPGRGLVLAAAAALLSACAGGGAAAPAPTAPAPDPDPDPAARGVPGFDTRDYPGDEVMRSWLAESPYRWVGFYLPAPCYTGTSWQGKRSALLDMGWGTAVLFVGEQDWPSTTSTARSADSPETDTADAAEVRCTRSNLSAERGRADGAAAADAVGAEGFPGGTVVYLDVEPVESVSDSLAAYVRGWTRGLVTRGFAPGLYAHARNAEALMDVMTDAVDGDSPSPRLWVASTGGFNLRRGPSESGFDAAIWQGVLDTHDTYGGTTLQIDRNVADRRDPSG